MVTGADHNRRARAAAVAQQAEGRTPRLDPRRHVAIVASRTRPNTRHEVQARLAGGELVTFCTCDAGRSSTRPAGVVPCWHGAALALAMEAHGLLVWSEQDGRWTPTRAVVQVEEPPATVPAPLPSPEAQAERRRMGPPRYGTPEYAANAAMLVD